MRFRFYATVGYEITWMNREKMKREREKNVCVCLYEKWMKSNMSKPEWTKEGAVLPTVEYDTFQRAEESVRLMNFIGNTD